MKALLFAMLAFFGANALADDHVREVKTANPFIELHPEAVRAAADEQKPDKIGKKLQQ